MAVIDNSHPKVVRRYETISDDTGWVVALLILLVLVVLGLLLWWRTHATPPAAPNTNINIPLPAGNASATDAGNTNTSQGNTVDSSSGTGNTNAGSAGSNVVTPPPPSVNNP